MKGQFIISSYEVHAQEDGEILIAKLVKETETQKQSIHISGQKPVDVPVGFAGKVELYIYDKAIQEQIKGNVGQPVNVVLGE